jgi:hypothetical protein
VTVITNDLRARLGLLARDVRQGCFNGTQDFGVWTTVASTTDPSDSSAARNRGVAAIHLVAANEGFAFHLESSAITRIVDFQWLLQPKTLNDSGQPDPSGNLHLTSYDIAYFDGSAPIVRTSFHGDYDGPFSDTGFTAYVDDELSLFYGTVQCDSTLGVDVDTTIDSVLNAIFNIAEDPTTSFSQIVSSGPGCLFSSFLPIQILIPGTTTKEAFTYTRVTADGTGLTAAGTRGVVPRQPSVTISGPAPLKVEVGDPLAGEYHATTRDLRPPLSVTWSSVSAAPASGVDATVVWNIPSLDQDGESATRNLTVNVTDADGAHVQALRIVKIEVLLGADISPLCRAKPYLPQCQ